VPSFRHVNSLLTMSLAVVAAELLRMEGGWIISHTVCQHPVLCSYAQE